MKDETLPSAWCCPNHPPGKQLLNFCERECWGCGEKRPPDAAVIKLNDLEPVGDVGELPRAKLATPNDDAADRGRRARVADLAWRLKMWATDAGRADQPEQALAYYKASEEVERVGQLCWNGFDVERDRYPAPLLR